MHSSVPRTSKKQRLWQQGQDLAAQGRWQEAAACFQAIVAHQSDHLPALLRASDALLELDQYRNARELLLQACSLGSPTPRLAIEIAQRLRRFHETQPLLELVARLDSIASCDAATLTELASLVSAAGDQHHAKILIDKATQAGPEHARAHYMRGVISMFHGEMDPARQELETCLALSPDHAHAHWVLSGIEQLDRNGGDALLSLRTALARAKPGSGDEAYLCYALHNELHARERHEEAWPALQRGCEVKRSLVPYDARQQADLFATVKSICTPAFVQSSMADDGCTPIFIIGMHRSGTTLLERILAGHGSVADGGETYTFTAQLSIASDHRIRDALDEAAAKALQGADFGKIGAGFWEASRWRSQGRLFMTEKLPSNLVNAGFIAKALPNAKFLHLVRDPVDTCFSNLRTYFNQVAAYSYDQLELADYYHRYRDLMEHWHAVMPGRILDVHYGDLVADTEATMRGVTQFCGMPFEAESLSLDRPTGAVSTASTAYVRKGILANRGAAWKPYQHHLQPMICALAGDG